MEETWSALYFTLIASVFFIFALLPASAAVLSLRSSPSWDPRYEPQALQPLLSAWQGCGMRTHICSCTCTVPQWFGWHRSSWGCCGELPAAADRGPAAESSSILRAPPQLGCAASLLRQLFSLPSFWYFQLHCRHLNRNHQDNILEAG